MLDFNHLIIIREMMINNLLPLHITSFSLPIGISASLIVAWRPTAPSERTRPSRHGGDVFN